MIKATDLEENTKTIEPWKKDLNINEKKIVILELVLIVNTLLTIHQNIQGEYVL